MFKEREWKPWSIGLYRPFGSSLHNGSQKSSIYILKKFGYSESDIEMVKIAGFMHDIGNVVNRSRHAEYGATFKLTANGSKVL